NGTRNQIQLTGVYGKWTTGSLNQGDDGISAYSFAFSQIALGCCGDTANNLPADNPLATITLIASATGIVDVNWHTAVDSFQLSFFGLTSAPGTSFTIVPEPETAALLAVS